MSINYVVTKKVDKTKGEVKVRYYATTRAMQKKPVDSSQIAMQLAERSSLQDGDVMSVLTQLSGIIAGHLHEGRTVSIDGLGNFFPTISSEGVEKPEECTADKVWVARIGFKAAPAFLKKFEEIDTSPVLLDLTVSIVCPLLYLVINSSACCKMGLRKPDYIEPYDFMIQENKNITSLELFQNLLFYWRSNTSWLY